MNVSDYADTETPISPVSMPRHPCPTVLTFVHEPFNLEPELARPRCTGCQA